MFRSFQLLLSFAAMFLVAGSIPCLRGADGPAAGFEAKETEGDGWRRKAEPFYQRALNALEMAERFYGKLGDQAGVARTVHRRAGLLVTLLDARSFVALEGEAGKNQFQPVPLPLTVPVKPGDLPPISLKEEDVDNMEELAKFLAQAGRAYFRSKEKEPRAFPLIFEALSLCERFLADAYQARADALYGEALLALESSSSGATSVEPVRRQAAKVRLKFKLRDLPGARLALAEAPIDEMKLPGTEKFQFLRLQRDLARFAGAHREALAFDQRLAELGAKAEELPLPAAPLFTFLTGKPADLSRFGKTLMAMASTRRLSARELTLTEFLAGSAMLEAGQPAPAAEILERINERWKPGDPSPPGAQNDPWLSARVAARLGEARDRIGDFEGAVVGFQKALSILAGLGEVERYRHKVAIDAAAALFSLGQFEEARKTALGVLSEKVAGDLRVRSRILLAGIVYSMAGDSVEDLKDTLSALDLAERERSEGEIEKATSDELRALILTYSGTVHRKLALLAEALATGGGSKAPPSSGVTGERQEAIRATREALRIAEESKLNRLSAACQANLGELYLESDDLASARRYVLSAMRLAEAEHAFETQWRTHWYLARIHNAEGNPEAADEEFEKAAKIVEAFRSRILDTDRKAGFMVSKVNLYESMVRQALERKNGPRAFYAAERCRARSFVESLGLRFLLIGADRDRSIYREYINLLSSTLQKAQGGGELFGVRLAGSYEEFREKLEALQLKIRKSPLISPMVHALVEGQPVDVPGVKKGLLPGERLVEFFGAGDAVIAFVIGADSFHAISLPGARGEIKLQAREFANSKASDPALASSLGRLLWEPLLEVLEKGGAEPPNAGRANKIDAIDTIIVVPWGELHRVPFEALQVRGRYLIERYAVAYLPAASVLKYLGKGVTKEERPRRLVAFVDPNTDYNGDGKPQMPPLRGARAEVEGIQPLFPETRVFLGDEATEAACVSSAPGWEVIHLACHGEFFHARPLDSRLYLSRDKTADGLLHASEIYGIDLRGTRLVALSGCETGLSRIEAGEDPVGIGTAVFHTGAEALLVSLWKVEDQSTSKLMKTFYRKWIEEGVTNRAQALREAKLALLRDEARTVPRLWAAFILVGPR